ncbi:MAG: 4Fe-4S binding protein [Thermodesulfobacteriota bacterium]
MNNIELYGKLAERYDNGQIVGAPMTKTLLKILMLLANPEEAEVALKLPFQNITLSEARELYPEKADRIEEILDGMAVKGTVFRDIHPSRGKRYRLLPSLVGWQETPFWHGKETEQAKVLSPLYKDYHQEAFAAEMARGMPLMRVIPIERSLKASSEILPFDEIKPLIDASSYQAVGHCPCRVTARFRGEPCDHSTENCLHFGSMGRYMVNHGLAREISKEETMKILKAADDEGLVHIIDNQEGQMHTICNCCKCCCSFLVPINENWGLDILSYSNYLAGVDAEVCIGCGTCEERCPVGAVKVIDEVARVDETRCLGCGACTSTCTTEAIRLSSRREIKPPPKIEEFLQARLR